MFLLPIIEAIPSLVGSLKPIDFYSCFISYSNKNQDFAERLYADLQAKGVHCWLDKEDLKIGEKFRSCIDEAYSSARQTASSALPTFSEKFLGRDGR